MTRYVIRRGQIDDCSQISVLMRELAESEDYGDRVEVSEDGKFFFLLFFCVYVLFVLFYSVLFVPFSFYLK